MKTGFSGLPLSWLVRYQYCRKGDKREPELVALKPTLHKITNYVWFFRGNWLFRKILGKKRLRTTHPIAKFVMQNSVRHRSLSMSVAPLHPPIQRRISLCMENT